MNDQHLVAELLIVAINKRTYRALEFTKHFPGLYFIMPLHRKMKDEGGRKVYVNVTVALILLIICG